MYLSDSECLVIGAVEAAAGFVDLKFFEQLQRINALLGFSEEPMFSDSFEKIPEVPPDTIWGMPDFSRRLSDADVRELRDLQHDKRQEAMSFLDSVESFSEQGRKVFGYFLDEAIAVGYAPSTPSIKYSLTRGGEFCIAERVGELPPGLLRVIVEGVAESTILPLGWRAAVGGKAMQIPDEFWQEVFQPGWQVLGTGCGNDQPDVRQRFLGSLEAAKTNADAHNLGKSLWSAAVCVEQILAVDRQDEPEPNASTKTPATDLGQSDRSHLPGLLREFFEDGDKVQNMSRADSDLKDYLSLMTDLARNHAELAASHSEILEMPNVTTVLSQLVERLEIWKDNIQLVAAYTGGFAGAFQMSDDVRAMLQSALCVAYGDLLLRERYSAAPLPQGEARQRLLRQPENIRVLITSALGNLRTDGEKKNFSAELLQLSVTLEHIVRDAAALFLHETSSYRVSDLLHELIEEGRRRGGQGNEDLLTIGRVGMTVHKSFRNRAVHEITTITGTVDEARFVAQGILVLLGAVERAAVAESRRSDGPR